MGCFLFHCSFCYCKKGEVGDYRCLGITIFEDFPMTFSRSNPSPRYLELIELNREMHEHGARRENIPSAETFPGMSLPPTLE